MDTNYIEIGEQIFNLVDNEKDKVNSFYDAMAQEDEHNSIQTWFDNNVKDNELQDLYKQGQNNQGLMNWLTSDEGHTYFLETPSEINTDNVDSSTIASIKSPSVSKEQIHNDIEKEDDEIMSDTQIEIKQDMSDGDYESDHIDDEDEIQMALDALESSDDTEDVNIIFDIIDGSEDDYEDDDNSEDEENIKDDEENIIHKKRIYLDHHINKVVESIDDDEETDRLTHKKYYVMKKPELGSPENLNKLEDELDKENISYYDFGKNNTIAIKIYTQNEVRLNRIFESLGFDSRCVDIAHYTDNWYSKS